MVGGIGQRQPVSRRGTLPPPSSGHAVHRAAPRSGGRACHDANMTAAGPWSMRRWAHVVDRPHEVDDALDRDDPYAGVALLVLVLNHPDPAVALPRIRRGLSMPSPQTRANALQSLGHYARLHRVVDAELIAILRVALRDRTALQGYELRGYASVAASDIAMFVARRELPRWFRRRFAGPH
jgi:hypothetical protein